MKNIKSAFSLVEVLILFTVMSVILAASLPTISKKSRAVPLKMQQGAYYCIANDDGEYVYDENQKRYIYRNGTYTVRQYIKGSPAPGGDNHAASCIFNPPARAAVFKITLIGAGAGGYNYVQVKNDTEHNPIKNVYKLVTKYTKKNDQDSYRELGPKELWDAFAGQTIQLCEAIPHGGDGASVKIDLPAADKGHCHCGVTQTSQANSSNYCDSDLNAATVYVTKAECDIKAGLRPHVLVPKNIPQTASGGIGGGKDLYVYGSYKIPTNPPRLSNGNYEQLLTLIGSLSSSGSCLNDCSSVKASVSGYKGTLYTGDGKSQNGSDAANASSTSPKDCNKATDDCQGGNGGNGSGKAVVIVPESTLKKANVYISQHTATGGKSAVAKANNTLVSRSNTPSLDGSYPGYDSSSDKESYVQKSGCNPFIPQLVFLTNFTRRKYTLGSWGKDGGYSHFMKYSLDGPCQITVGQGGPAFEGDYELYPSSVDMETRITCRGFTKAVSGGYPRSDVRVKYDQYKYEKNANTGELIGTVPVKTVYADKPELQDEDSNYYTPREKMARELFFRLYEPNLFNGIGEGGRGRGFVDQCTGKSKDTPELNRYAGDFTVSIGNAKNESAPTTATDIKEELTSTCIDVTESNSNQYGTVEGKYELIDAQPGRGGAVIITW